MFTLHVHTYSLILYIVAVKRFRLDGVFLCVFSAHKFINKNRQRFSQGSATGI